jgi:hypothetical protein
METCEVTFDELSLSVQVMMKLARRYLRTRRMMLERMMVMMVKI